MREEAERLEEKVRGGTGRWPQQACGQEICLSRKRLFIIMFLRARHWVLCFVQPNESGPRCRIPFLQDVSNILQSTSTTRLHKSPHHVARATKFCNVEPNICGSLVWNLPHVPLWAPRILRWFLNFWKISLPWA